MNDASDIDFSPFDADANLTALCQTVRALRTISWSYAGDIQAAAFKIARMFDASRCAIMVNTEEDGILVYEHTEPSVEPLADYLESEPGQRWLTRFLYVSQEYVSPEAGSETGDGAGPDTADDTAGDTAINRLLNPPSYLFPLRSHSSSRYARKPGLLLIQEPRGLNRWSRRLLETIVVIAEYLAMVIECERLSDQLNNQRAKPKEPGT